VGFSLADLSCISSSTTGRGAAVSVLPVPESGCCCTLKRQVLLLIALSPLFSLMAQDVAPQATLWFNPGDFRVPSAPPPNIANDCK
jgi:hypothetical protein